MSRPKKRAHQITHAQRFFEHNRPALRKVIEELQAKATELQDAPMTRMAVRPEIVVQARKLMTPAELTLQRRKELRPKVTVIK